MARAMQNPFEKLITLSAQLDNVIKAIFESAGSPEFLSSLSELKSKLINDNPEEISKDTTEIVKLLQMYEGLSKPTLAYLKSKINEYKDLGVLNNYKSMVEAVDNKAKKTAKNAS